MQIIQKNAKAKDVALFNGCRDVLGVASIYRPNEEIYGEGEPAENVYKVLRGVVRTYKLLDDGRRQVAAFYFPDEVFGLGHRLIKSHPDSDGSEFDGSEIVFRTLVVSGCDGSEVFELVEEALDEIAVAIEEG